MKECAHLGESHIATERDKTVSSTVLGILDDSFHDARLEFLQFLERYYADILALKMFRRERGLHTQCRCVIVGRSCRGNTPQEKSGVANYNALQGGFKLRENQFGARSSIGVQSKCLRAIMRDLKSIRIVAKWWSLWNNNYYESMIYCDLSRHDRPRYVDGYFTDS